jgi:hypothetical protein
MCIDDGADTLMNSCQARLKGVLKKHSALNSAAKTIGAGRTVYDEDSYNGQAAPGAELAILGDAIDKIAAGLAVDAAGRNSQIFLFPLTLAVVNDAQTDF